MWRNFVFLQNSLFSWEVFTVISIKILFFWEKDKIFVSWFFPVCKKPVFDCRLHWEKCGEILFFSKILCFCFCYTLYVYFSYTLYVYFCYTLYVCFCYTLYVVFVTLCMFVFCYTLYVCFCYTLYVCFCYTLYVYFCYTLYVYFCYTLYVCFCYTLYVRNSKSLKLEKFEVGKDRSSKRSTLQKFEVRNVLFLLALIWLIKFRLYNNII